MPSPTAAAIYGLLYNYIISIISISTSILGAHVHVTALGSKPNEALYTHLIIYNVNTYSQAKSAKSAKYIRITMHEVCCNGYGRQYISKMDYIIGSGRYTIMHIPMLPCIAG